VTFGAQFLLLIGLGNWRLFCRQFFRSALGPDARFLGGDLNALQGGNSPGAETK